MDNEHKSQAVRSCLCRCDNPPDSDGIWVSLRQSHRCCLSHSTSKIQQEIQQEKQGAALAQLEPVSHRCFFPDSRGNPARLLPGGQQPWAVLLPLAHNYSKGSRLQINVFFCFTWLEEWGNVTLGCKLVGVCYLLFELVFPAVLAGVGCAFCLQKGRL